MKRASPTVAAALAAALLTLAAAGQDLAAGASSPRRIELVAPDGTFFVARARGLRVDIAGLIARAARLFARGAPLYDLLDGPDAERAHHVLGLARGFERNAVGAAVEELSNGEVLLGLRLAGNRPRPFVVARVRDAAAARRAAKPFARTFRLPVAHDGAFVWWAGGPANERALTAAIEDVTQGRAGATGARILRELDTGAPLAAWLDLSATVAGKRVRAALSRMPNDPGAAFLAGGLGRSIARAASLVAEARFARDDVRIELRAPGVAGEVPRWTREVLGLDRPRLPEAPELPGMVARFKLSRSLASYLAHKERVAGPGAQDNIQQFLAGMEQIFRGARVEEDVLPQMVPGLTGIATLPRERGDDDREHPFRLPEGAFAAGLTGPGRLANSLEAALQLVTVIQNNQRRRDGKLGLRLRGRKEDGLRVLATAPVPPSGGRPWPIQAAFAPVLVRGDRHFSIGFSKSLGKELVAKLAEIGDDSSDAGRRVLDALEVRFDRVATSILQNRKLIEASLLVERGWDYTRSRPWTDALAAVARVLGRARIETGFDGDDWFASLRWRPDFDRRVTR